MDVYDKAGSGIAAIIAAIILYFLMTMDFSHPAEIEHAVIFDGSNSLLIPADADVHLEAIDDSTFVDLVSCDTFRLGHKAAVSVAFDGVDAFKDSLWKSDE